MDEWEVEGGAPPFALFVVPDITPEKASLLDEDPVGFPCASRASIQHLTFVPTETFVA